MRFVAALGLLVREAPDAVAEHYEREIAAGADVVAAFTAQTSTRALNRIGMGYRAAALTGAAPGSPSASRSVTAEATVGAQREARKRGRARAGGPGWQPGPGSGPRWAARVTASGPGSPSARFCYAGESEGILEIKN